MKRRIVFVTSDLYYVNSFLSRQILAVSETYDLVLVVNADPKEAGAAIGNCGVVRNVGIVRKISLWKDLITFVRLWWLFLRFKPDIVHSTTPKAGLLSMVAAFLAGVPFRLHTFTGQVWQTKKGFMRWLLVRTDMITAKFASGILADSVGQLEVLIAHRIVGAGKSAVLGYGSICGVDLHRFQPDPAARLKLRQSLGVEEAAVMILFMARFTIDKGAMLMCEAYRELSASTDRRLHLLMVGPDEECLAPKIVSRLAEGRENFLVVPYTHAPENYFQSCDIFCLPSSREGFPMVLLNAAACEVPAVASRIYGSVDAIEDGVTGLLFEVGDVAALVGCLRTLVESPDVRTRMGKAARAIVASRFAADQVTARLLAVYGRRSVNVDAL